MPMHWFGRKPVYMQNFRFIGAMVSEFRFFKKKKKMKKKKKKKKNMDNLIKSCLPVFRTSYDIFIRFFCMLLLFHVFSTLMSLKVRLD